MAIGGTDREDLQDNASQSVCACFADLNFLFCRLKVYNDCFADLNFLGAAPLNLGQHAFKTTAITFISPKIEKTNFS